MTKILKASNAVSNLDSSWGWPCNKSFLLSKTSLDCKWTRVRHKRKLHFFLLEKLCMGSTFSVGGCSFLLISIKFGCHQSVSGLGQVIWTSFVILGSENVVVYSGCKYNSDKSFCLHSWFPIQMIFVSIIGSWLLIISTFKEGDWHSNVLPLPSRTCWGSEAGCERFCERPGNAICHNATIFVVFLANAILRKEQKYGENQFSMVVMGRYHQLCWENDKKSISNC